MSELWQIICQTNIDAKKPLKIRVAQCNQAG